uniref:Uncharacterized protein n=1 Tax=Pithovirus LCPAC103 TaxID=2506588 RepID=A0A481Z5P2_9VIRU|nr:MAG: hypothetical protein LCPAC103_00810 [Pithovirus LCPAC103]
MFKRQSLYDVSPTFAELAHETLQAVGNWWFDQIKTDGIIKFGDPCDKNMESKANMLVAIGGGYGPSKSLPDDARQIFVDKLIETCLKYYAGWGGGRPKCPTTDLCYSLGIDYGITEESMFTPALEAIGIDRDSNPLPMKTNVWIRPGLAIGTPNRIIYSDKDKWLRVWKEIDTKIVSWDGEKLFLNTKLLENNQYCGTELVSPEELYNFLQR